jgi:hypothetical protein
LTKLAPYQDHRIPKAIRPDVTVLRELRQGTASAAPSDMDRVDRIWYFG